MALTDKLSAIGDAIREKTGKTELLTLEAMADEIGAIETGGGGDTSMEDSLITGTLTSYTNDRVESVRGYAFYGLEITHLDLPNVKTLANYALTHSRFTGVNLPLLETIGINAFYNSQIPSITLPKTKVLADSCFMNCTKLKHADFPMATTIKSQCFFASNLLETLILRNSEKVCSVANGTLTNNTGSKTNVYVPAALIESYKTATNWSAMFEKGYVTFVAIEGSEYE